MVANRSLNLAMTGEPLVDHFEIGLGRRPKTKAARHESLHGFVYVRGAKRDMLDALAVVGGEVFGDL